MTRTPAPNQSRPFAPWRAEVTAKLKALLSDSNVFVRLEAANAVVYRMPEDALAALLSIAREAKSEYDTTVIDDRFLHAVDRLGARAKPLEAELRRIREMFRQTNHETEADLVSGMLEAIKGK